jgi:hypothetical protein
MLAQIASWAASKVEPIPIFEAFLRCIGRDVNAAYNRLEPEQQKEVLVTDEEVRGLNGTIVIRLFTSRPLTGLNTEPHNWLGGGFRGNTVAVFTPAIYTG